MKSIGTSTEDPEEDQELLDAVREVKLGMAKVEIGFEAGWEFGIETEEANAEAE